VYIDHESGLKLLPLRAPTKADLAAISWDTCQRTIAMLRTQGRWLDVDPPEDTFAQDEPGLAVAASASIQGVLSMGPHAGQRLMRFHGEPARETDTPETQTPGYGFDLHAGVVVPAGDKKKLERLCRYASRPPIANDRLARLDDGRVSLRLKKSWSDGSTHVIFEELDFMSKLAALIPPPRMNLVRFHGIFAPNAKRRRFAVPEPKPDSDESSEKGESTCPSGWAKLLARVFDIDVLECKKCGGRLRIIAAITKHEAIRAILRSVGLSADAPIPWPARAPTQPELDFQAA
jgi:hypothetical protein